MLDKYALVPDIFDSTAYSNPAFIEMCLPHLKEPILQEALVRDLCNGGWSQFCSQNSGSLHRLCKEILRKLSSGNRLRHFPRKESTVPQSAADWCQEALSTSSAEPLSGIIAGHNTKQHFTNAEVASIEKLTGALWWQARKPSGSLIMLPWELPSVANTKAVPILGCPAKGNSARGLKIRTSAVCGPFGGRTNVVSARLNSAAMDCICSVVNP
jgi:hypothetical protein